MLTTTSADGTEVRAYDEGQGPPVILIGPGLDDGRRCARLAALLSPRFRVLRPHRRQYRPDLKGDSPCSVADEVEDILAIVRAVGEPTVVYGHSSGGVIALESLVAAPSAFAGAVIFEPATVIGTPWTGEDGVVLARARAAVAAGRPGEAMTIFSRDAVGLPGWQASLVGMFTALAPRYRSLVACQLDDLEAMDRLGVRLDAHARIDSPTVLLDGDRSPQGLLDRVDALERVMPRAERVTLRGYNHGADVRSPKRFARIIETLAEEVLQRPE